MNFTRRVDVEFGYEDAVERVTAALGEQGFGVLTEIDVRRTLKDKLGIDTEAQVILGACNPQLAHRAIEIDSRVAALLPCNVVVRTEDGHSVIEALDPAVLAEMTGNPALAPIAEDAAKRIGTALDSLRPT